MKINTKTRLLIVLSILLAAALACGLFPAGDEDAGDASIAGEGSEEDEEDAAEEGSEESDGSDACIVGTWVVDNASMQAYMDESMNQNEDVFIVGEVSGEMYFTYGADGIMSMSSENFSMAVSLDTGVEDFSISMTFVIVAEGSAHYEADGSKLTNTERDYSFEETTIESMLDFSGGDATIELTINPGMFIAGQEDAARDEFSTTYECSGNKLTLTGPELFDVMFTRVE